MPRPKHTVAYRERMKRKRRNQLYRAFSRRWNVFHGRVANDNGPSYLVSHDIEVTVDVADNIKALKEGTK
jgi:hypothetical protein